MLKQNVCSSLDLHVNDTTSKVLSQPRAFLTARKLNIKWINFFNSKSLSSHITMVLDVCETCDLGFRFVEKTNLTTLTWHWYTFKVLLHHIHYSFYFIGLGLSAFKMMSDASDMLAAALEQMDGIIAGNVPLWLKTSTIWFSQILIKWWIWAFERLELLLSHHWYK